MWIKKQEEQIFFDRREMFINKKKRKELVKHEFRMEKFLGAPL